ncbi:MAG: hypothetical protein PHO91_00795 [Patescibacteria group bacterium]|nr:hypothetical protein [Patescibacteria group bacterium]
MKLIHDSDVAFMREGIEIFKLGSTWPLFLLLVIGFFILMYRKKDERKNRHYVEWGMVMGWSFIAFVGICFIFLMADLPLSEMLGKPSWPSWLKSGSGTVSEVIDSTSGAVASTTGGKVTKEEVPIWQDLVALLLALWVGGIFWFRRRRWNALLSVALIAVVYTVIRGKIGFSFGTTVETPDIPIGKLIAVILIAVLASIRIIQAIKQGQWLVTLDPISREPFAFKFLFFYPPLICFLLFNLTIIISIVSPKTMFGGLGIILTPLVVIVLYLLSALIKLPTAHSLVYEWFGSDVYDPIFYFWGEEKKDMFELEQDIEEDGKTQKVYLIKKGEDLHCFRKGIWLSLISVWLPSAIVRAYIFREEVWELDTFKSEKLPTSRIPYPESDDFDSGIMKYEGSDGGKKVSVEAGPEVEVEINLSVFTWPRKEDKENFLRLKDEDRKDKENLIKRRSLWPALARFLSRMTMDQALFARLLTSNKRFLMDGKPVSFRQYVYDDLKSLGFHVYSLRTGDINPPEAIRDAQEKLKAAQTKVLQMLQEGEGVDQKAKGEGKAILSTLEPLAAALGGDMQAAMRYHMALKLFEGQNRFFAALPPELMESLGKIFKTGGVTPPTS